MVIRFELPDDVERELSRQFGDLGDAAKEALLIEAFRLGKLSHHELSVPWAWIATKRMPSSRNTR